MKRFHWKLYVCICVCFIVTSLVLCMDGASAQRQVRERQGTENVVIPTMDIFCAELDCFHVPEYGANLTIRQPQALGSVLGDQRTVATVLSHAPARFQTSWYEQYTPGLNVCPCLVRMGAEDAFVENSTRDDESGPLDCIRYGGAIGLDYWRPAGTGIVQYRDASHCEYAGYFNHPPRCVRMLLEDWDDWAVCAVNYG